MKSLRERFEDFICTLDGYENIDDLLKGKDFKGKKRADYFLYQRNFIIEQKTLEINPEDKPQKFIERIIKERDLIVYGTVSSDMIFKSLPDGKDLQRRMILKITEAIEDNVEKADKQTRDTREIFSTPEATGILVILNQGAEMLDAELIGFSLSTTFQKKKQDGSLRYPQNDGILLISEAQILAVPGYPKTYPIMSYVGSKKEKEGQVLKILDELKRKWAEFNSVPLIKFSESDLPDFVKRAKGNNPNQQI